MLIKMCGWVLWIVMEEGILLVIRIKMFRECVYNFIGKKRCKRNNVILIVGDWFYIVLDMCFIYGNMWVF